MERAFMAVKREDILAALKQVVDPTFLLVWKSLLLVCCSILCCSMALAQESSDPLVDKIVEEILSGQAYLPRDHPERQRYPFAEGRRKITCIICPHPGELR